MAHRRHLIAVFILLLSPSLSLSSTTLHPDCERSFNVSSQFTAAVRSTLSDIRHLISTVASFSGSNTTSRRLSSAVCDCLELLGLSASELSLTLSASELSLTLDSSLSSSTLATADRRADIRSWLSAALGNQDTCRESLSSTSSALASLVAPGLDSVDGAVAAALADVGRRRPRARKLGGGGGGLLIPKWARRVLQQVGPAEANVVVAKDGSGNFTTVGEAVEAAPVESKGRFVIYVKEGVYSENVEIKKKKWNVMIVGDGVDRTVISGSRNFVDGWTTYRSATLGVSGKGFMARDLTVENTAGPSKHQAVAFRSDSDLSVYYHCAFKGYQDTLYAHSLRQFYRECIITGTIDFIFGNAAAVFQNSLIIVRHPLPNQKNTVTAQGRKDPNQNTGFSFQFCNITASSDLVGSMSQTYSYLGRPWKQYSTTMVMQSYLGSVIRPEGWLAWQDDFALSTLYYGEYMNYGPSSGLAGRVNWTGYHAINSSAEATKFTVAQFIEGNLWLPSSGVTYVAGLEE